MVYLTNATVILQCTRSQVDTVPTAGLSGKHSLLEYTCQTFAWSLWSRSHDSHTWSITIRRTTRDCPHTHALLLCLPSINESWECNKYHVGDSFDLCNTYRQSVINGQVANIFTSAPFPRRGIHKWQMCVKYTNRGNAALHRNNNNCDR
jgi:hypothetical protein